MNEGAEPISVTVHGAIREIPAAEWDACAGYVNPTVSHAFLSVLEESGSATASRPVRPRRRAPHELTFTLDQADVARNDRAEPDWLSADRRTAFERSACM